MADCGIKGAMKIIRKMGMGMKKNKKKGGTYVKHFKKQRAI